MMCAVPSSSRCRSNLAARILAAAAPSTAVWAFAVHAAGLFRWGIASGLCVGLFCAALTLKSISFVQRACPCPCPARPPPASLAGAGVTEATAATAPARRSAEGPMTRSRSREEETDAGVDAPAPQQQGQRRGDGLPSCQTGTPAAPAAPALTFGEFAFFLLLAPSLVCEPRLLASSARRPRRVAAAASEFLHAGLAYLAVHATCSALFAPTLRVLAAALHSGWADEEGWAELRRADSSGWWLHSGTGTDHVSHFGNGGGCWAEGGGGGGVCGEGEPALEWFGQQGLTTVAVAGCLGMCVLTPLMHFLMFYAFFHSVCLGCAELWGYPDRNIYGELRYDLSKPLTHRYFYCCSL